MKIYASRMNYSDIRDYVGTDLWVKVMDTGFRGREIYIQVLSVQDPTNMKFPQVPGVFCNVVDAMWIDHPAHRPFLSRNFLSEVLCDEFLSMSGVHIVHPVEVLTQDEIVSRYMENCV